MAARRRSSAAAWRRRLLAGLGVVVLVAVAAFAISRLFADEIREVTLPLRHDDVVRQEARDEDVATVDGMAIPLPPTDPALLAAVIYEESRFQDQTSEAGARGLMQITPDTADTIEGLSGGETFVFEDLADPELNIRYGSFYLRHLLYRYGGNEEAALAAYNAGPGNADSWGGSDLEVDDVAFEETRAYVENVLERRDEYRKNYAEDLGL